MRLVAKAPAFAIDLNAALHDRRPGDQDIVRRRDRAVTLIGAKMGKLSAKRIAPDDGIAPVTRVTKVERARHFRNVAADELGISAKPVAGEDHRSPTDALAAAVTASDFDAADAAFGICKQALGRAFCENDDVVRFGGTAQPIDQLTAGTTSEGLLRMAEWPG